ncbi:hypothetical protein M3Y96_00471300 [Aphelenchoides besseyi]|nr:hypothetical protein M3Y96_00471300 [Aphelenchoides besseyi]
MTLRGELQHLHVHNDSLVLPFLRVNEKFLYEKFYEFCLLHLIDSTKMPSGSDGQFPRSRWTFVVGFLLNCLSVQSIRHSCTFPETASQSFFFDLDASTPAGTVIVNSVVEPADARLEIKNIRSNNLKIDFDNHFQIQTQSNGQFVITTAQNLNLPSYPSTVNESILYITVMCNHASHPLMTIRIRNRNTFAPTFLNEPYEIFIPQDIRVGAIINTPVIAIDEDPAPSYTVGYELAAGSSRSEFAIATEVSEAVDLQTLPEPFASKRYARVQMPTAVQLRVKSPLRKKIYYLNVTASDQQTPPKRSSTLLKIVVGQPADISPHFSQREYYANFTTTWDPDTELVLNQPIIAFFPERSLWANRRTNSRPNEEISYEIVPSQFSRLFELNSQTARLYLKVRPYEDVPSTIELRIRAFPNSNPDVTIESKIILTDVSEVKLTYFAQCHYDVHLPENSPVNTKVTKFVVRGDIAGIDLLNGTEYFDVALDGVVTVTKNAVIDYEEIDHIIVKARLRSAGALHPKSLELCQIATVDVHVEDENDHSPRFPKTMFTFYTDDENPYNNTEIGTIRATDEDKGRYGKVNYRILEDSADFIPFTLFESDGAATIYFTQPERVFYPESSYTFTVEAYDAKENPRTSRVSVRVMFQSKPQDEPADSNEAVETTQKSTKSITTEPTTTFVTTTEQAATETTSPRPSKIVKIRKKAHRTLGAVNEPAGAEHPLDNLTNDEESTDEEEKIESDEAFERSHFNFTLTGPIDHGQYIGTIRLRQDDKIREDEEEQPPVEYAVENGIKGFVRIDPTYGIIRVDEKLIEDSYEQIRFAAQAYRKGQLVQNKFSLHFFWSLNSLLQNDH